MAWDLGDVEDTHEDVAVIRDLALDEAYQLLGRSPLGLDWALPSP
jgi:hypothetical protein